MTSEPLETAYTGWWHDQVTQEALAYIRRKATESAIQAARTAGRNGPNNHLEHNRLVKADALFDLLDEFVSPHKCPFAPERK